MADKKMPQSVEELKAKYVKVYTITTIIAEEDDSEISKEYIFKKPSTASYDRFVKTAASSATKASKAFVLDNVVEEQRTQLEADLEEYPAMAMSLNERLFALLGLSKDMSVKKL